MPRASDGTPHHSFGRAKMHDEKMSGGTATKSLPSSEKKTAQPMEGGMNHPTPTATPIEEHVSQHGPAHSMDYEHDKASNLHHITSQHGEGEGQPHHSQHKSKEAAHEHIGKAMGVQEDQSEKDNESPDQSDESDAEMATSGGGIPGMA